MTIKNSEEGRATVMARYSSPRSPNVPWLRRQLAFDLSHGDNSKAERIMGLPLFLVAFGDHPDQVLQDLSQ